MASAGVRFGKSLHQNSASSQIIPTLADNSPHKFEDYNADEVKMFDLGSSRKSFQLSRDSYSSNVCKAQQKFLSAAQMLGHHYQQLQNENNNKDENYRKQLQERLSYLFKVHKKLKMNKVIKNTKFVLPASRFDKDLKNGRNRKVLSQRSSQFVNINED